MFIEGLGIELKLKNNLKKTSKSFCQNKNSLYICIRFQKESKRSKRFWNDYKKSTSSILVFLQDKLIKFSVEKYCVMRLTKFIDIIEIDSVNKE